MLARNSNIIIVLGTIWIVRYDRYDSSVIELLTRVPVEPYIFIVCMLIPHFLQHCYRGREFWLAVTGKEE